MFVEEIYRKRALSNDTRASEKEREKEMERKKRRRLSEKN